jgi:hypothetical protein
MAQVGGWVSGSREERERCAYASAGGGTARVMDR